MITIRVRDRVSV